MDLGDLGRRFRRAMDTVADGDRELGTGGFARAAALYGSAEEAWVGLVDALPDEPAHHYHLGRTRYAAGSALIAAGDHAGAVARLKGAEAAYTTLGELGHDPDQVALWVADVRCRRARAHAFSAAPASALADGQAAVVAYVARWDGDTRHPLALDVARTLGWCAQVTALVGDPDLAVAAADVALLVYMSRVAEAGAAPDDWAPHPPVIALAARVSAAVHAAHRRDEHARASAELAGTMPAVDMGPIPTAAEVAAMPTLSDALDRVGAPLDLRHALTAPPLDQRFLVPLDRCGPELAPARAGQLADLVPHVVVEAPAMALRLALEAHALFAGASEARTAATRYTFGSWGPPWAEMLLAVSDMCFRAGREREALDLASWMAGVVDGLAPHVIGDPATLATARRCVTWLGQLMGATGQEDRAREAREALATLDRLGPVGS